MAELVDALVSNTNRFTPVPVRSRLRVLEEKFERTSLFLLVFFVLAQSESNGIALCMIVKTSELNKFPSLLSTITQRLRLFALREN